MPRSIGPCSKHDFLCVQHTGRCLVPFYKTEKLKLTVLEARRVKEDRRHRIQESINVCISTMPFICESPQRSADLVTVVRKVSYAAILLPSTSTVHGSINFSLLAYEDLTAVPAQLGWC
jgi:hypothetical protein